MCLEQAELGLAGDATATDGVDEGCVCLGGLEPVEIAMGGIAVERRLVGGIWNLIRFKHFSVVFLGKVQVVVW